MVAARNAAIAAVLAWGSWVTGARADVEYVGPASDGSIRSSVRVVSPRDAPAKAAVDPGRAAAAAPVVDSLDSPSVQAVSPRELSRGTEALRPGSTQLEAISPSDRPALPALSPGESRSREVYNPRHYGRPPDAAPVAAVVTEGPSAQGSVRQPLRASAFPTDAAGPEPHGGAVDVASFGRGALAGETGAAAVWRGRRVMPASIYQGWLCRSRDFVKHGDDTLQVCDGVWVQRLMWSGQTGYVPIYPPEGAEIERLPGDQETVSAGGRTHVVAAATFYERVADGGAERYRVVRPPLGAVVSSIPRMALDLGSGVFQYDTVFFRKRSGGYEVIADPS